MRKAGSSGSAAIWRQVLERSVVRAGAFRRDERGVTAVIFAVVFSAVMLMAAVAVDYGRVGSDKLRMQNALDGATLAASHKLGLPDQDTAGPKMAVDYFNVNMVKRKNVGVLLESDVEMDEDKGEVRTRAHGNMLTSLLRAVGIEGFGFNVGSQVKKGEGTVEVALVLDNSGSMAGQPIEDLKTAAQSLLGVVFTGAEGTDKVRVGMVPFAGAVNVGSANKTASWIDSGAVAPTHSENFEAAANRFDVLAQMGQTWGGCVEARPSPYDVTDATPVAETPATLFVPMFAPDEPDTANAGGNTYTNNYLSDTGGTCPVPPAPTCLNYSRRGNCTEWSTPTPLEPATAQARLCKYNGATANTSPANGTRLGPNMLCDSKPIMPLTSDKSALNSAVGDLTALGGTNIVEGVMWGWRVLSPGAPFTEGRSYDEPKNNKYIILMTDGANWHGALSNHNKSWYHSFGYAVKGRLGSTMTTSALIAQMNTKTLAACANAKAAGLKIYTIAFRLESDAATRALLASCASSSSDSYAASDGTALISAFESIGREIAKLRVAG